MVNPLPVVNRVPDFLLIKIKTTINKRLQIEFRIRKVFLKGLMVMGVTKKIKGLNIIRLSSIIS